MVKIFSKERFKKFLFPFFIIVLVFGIIITASLVAYKQRGLPSWKTYENLEFEYKIQYLSSWYVKEFKIYPEIGPFPSFRFQNKEKVDLIKPMKSHLHGSVFEIVLHQASDFNPPARNLEVLDIDGMTAKCYLSSNYGPVFDCWVWANRDDYFFRLAGYATNEKERAKNSEVLEKMLASFKIKQRD